MATTTFSVLVENKFWVLAKISRLFSRHTFNIQSLTVAPTLDEKVSLMTIDIEEDAYRIKRMKVELQKMINVLKVDICDNEHYIETELVLIKLDKKAEDHKKLLEKLEAFEVRILFQHEDIEIIEFSGDKTEITHFLHVISAFKIIEIFRTGTLAITKV